MAEAAAGPAPRPSFAWKTKLDSLFFEKPGCTLYTKPHNDVPLAEYHNTRVLRALLCQSISTADTVVTDISVTIGIIEWIRKNSHRGLVLALHGCPSESATADIFRNGFKVGPRGKGGFGVYGTTRCDEAMYYAVDPAKTADPNSFCLVGFIGVTGINPGQGPKVDSAGKPLVVDKGKPHLYGNNNLMHGVFHPDDTKVAFTFFFKKYDYQRMHGMWTLSRRVSFKPATGACRLGVFPPYGHGSSRMEHAMDWARQLRPEARYDHKNWVSALGSVVVSGFCALFARTSPAHTQTPGTVHGPADFARLSGTLRPHMDKWKQIEADAAQRCTQGDEGIYETLGHVWDWAKALVPHAKLTDSDTDQGCVAAYFRLVFDAAVLLVRAISLTIGSFPEDADHAEACVTLRAAKFVRTELFGAAPHLNDRSDTVKKALGSFFPADRPPIMFTGGEVRPAVRNSQLCLTILSLGASGSSADTAVVVPDNDDDEDEPDETAAGHRKRSPPAELPPRPAKRPAQGDEGDGGGPASTELAASALLDLAGMSAQ